MMELGIEYNTFQYIKLSGSEDGSEENFTVLGYHLIKQYCLKTITETKTSTITIKFISTKLGVSDSVGKKPYNYPITDLE